MTQDNFAERCAYIVDDDQAVRDSLLWLMEGAGLKAKGYASASTFLAEAGAELSRVAGCVIIDVRLPGGSGLELQRQLHDLEIFLPVIMVTGHGQVDEAVQAIKAGAADYIEKPFSGADLADLVVRLIEDVEATRPRPRAGDLAARPLLIDAAIAISDQS